MITKYYTKYIIKNVQIIIFYYMDSDTISFLLWTKKNRFGLKSKGNDQRVIILLYNRIE